MKIMLKIWVLVGVLVPVVFSQYTYDSEYDSLSQDTYKDSDEKSDYPSGRRHHHLRSYEPTSYEDDSSSDHKHYQSLEPSYRKREPESYAHAPRYHVAPQQVQYHQPEDPSYHRPQEIVYHQAPREAVPKYQSHQYYRQEPVPEHQEPPHYRQEVVPEHQTPQHYRREVVTEHQPPQHYHQEVIPKHQSPQHYQEADPEHQVPQHYQEETPEHQGSYEKSTHQLEPDEKDDSKYTAEEPKYVPPLKPSRSSHPAPVPTDKKLPLYFTMYEKRVIQDPLTKYGKGPWRYLTYGHGITYGSKEPGKVFEKGYGYIRALGRDHCKLPEHLCPPRDEKPFDYEGRKEPYFGYRPH